MKNFLIVLAVLFVCFVIAAALVFILNMGGGRGIPGGLHYVIAEWRDYDDPGLVGLEVTICDNQIIVDVPPDKGGPFKRITEKGHWTMHSFYCDSYLDAPAEVVVARQLKNEDLELDAGRFLQGRSGKIVCVKVMRGLKDYRPPYPVNVPGQTVTYPPPRGLIRFGMLECDLQMLPWHADRVDLTPIVVTVNTTTLSDGKQNKNYYPSNNDNGDDPSSVYTYHSDRTDAPKLLVTVYHGRVVQAVGGAEETANIPYQLPPPPAPDMGQGQDKDTSWMGWLFDLLFKK